MHDLLDNGARHPAAEAAPVSHTPVLDCVLPSDSSGAGRAARRFIVNGRFLATEPVGVHRVATELVRHAHALIASDLSLARRISLELWIPSDAQSRAKVLGLPYRVVGPLNGNAWEQLTLPLRAGRATVVSLCNVGPVLRRNAVTMMHDVQVLLSPASYSSSFRRWYRLQQPMAGKRHRRILTVSEYSRDQIISAKVAPAEKITVIHNGCDHVLADNADDAVLKRLNLAKGSYTLALSSLQAHKNIAVLLRAFARPELQDRTLVLFGSTSREKFVSAGYDVPSNVLFTGRVSDGELRALYESAAVFAFPSTTEGFGLPPLEAMRLGTPAIVAPCGALPEACGDGALYVAQDDPAAWAAAIAAVYDGSRDRSDLSARALDRADQLTWDRAARNLINTLLSL
ncbi:glycosyltransferase family 1 protein [Croceicoccus sp. Ery15]|uniref:glycosyltransferase family 4 protein n=1 Tax=Croceicoccus sp. Ery15 TaxID=1703338 RepID=UPI001E64BC27|nr:glycosyltransferase family 1 protein [Croceicoccus sp. Ery15]